MTFQDELAIGYLGFFIIVLLGACESQPKFNFHHYIEDGGKRVLSTEGVLDDAGVPNGNFNIYISGDELWSGNYQRGVKTGLWKYTKEGASRANSWVTVETGAMLFSVPGTWMDTVIRRDDSTFFAQGLHAGSKKRSGGVVISRGTIPPRTTLEALFDEAKARFDTLGFTAVNRTREFAEPFDLNGLYVAIYLPKDSTVSTAHVHLIYQNAPSSFLEIYRACIKSELEWNVFLVSEVFYDLRVDEKPLVNRWAIEGVIDK